MKTSELVKLLQDSISQNGDLDVVSINELGFTLTVVRIEIEKVDAFKEDKRLNICTE